MQISNRDLRGALKEVWPSLRHIWLFDRVYNVPTVAKLKSTCNLIKDVTISLSNREVHIEDLHNVGEVWDCDDISMLAAALVKLVAKEKGAQLPQPFGRAMGNEFRGMQILHSLNICYTQDGVYFVDYDDWGRIWKADPENDNIFFVSI
jgi:hypothetical protein